MMDQVAQWLKDMGWKALWTLSVKTEVGGLSVGAAVLTRDLLALRIPEGGSVVSPARAVAAAVHPPGFRAFVIYSMYFWCSEGLSERNRELIAAVGGHAGNRGLGV